MKADLHATSDIPYTKTRCKICPKRAAILVKFMEGEILLSVRYGRRGEKEKGSVTVTSRFKER